MNHKLVETREFSTSRHDDVLDNNIKKHLVAKYKNSIVDRSNIKHSQHEAVNKLPQSIKDPRRN